MSNVTNTNENCRKVRLYKAVFIASMVALLGAIPFTHHIMERNKDVLEFGSIVGDSALKTGQSLISNNVGE